MKRSIIYFLILGWLCQGYGCETGDKYQEAPSRLIEDIYQPKNPQFTRYLHFPEYNIFYDLDSAQYIFLEDNHWKREEDLPIQYSKVKIWRTAIREMKYQGDKPQIQSPDYFPIEPADTLPNYQRSDSIAL